MTPNTPITLHISSGEAWSREEKVVVKSEECEWRCGCYTQLHRMTSQDCVFYLRDHSIRPLSSVVERVIPAADSRNLHKVVRSIRAGVTLLFREQQELGERSVVRSSRHSRRGNFRPFNLAGVLCTAGWGVKRSRGFTTCPVHTMSSGRCTNTEGLSVRQVAHLLFNTHSPWCAAGW
jgi:hypothetical protein